MKKRNLLLIISVFVVLLSLSACGKDMSNSKYLGEWKATTAEYSGMEMSVETIIGGEFIFDLKDDGSCTMTIKGEEKSGKWDETETGFIVEDELEVKVDGKTGTLDYDGTILKFKQK